MNINALVNADHTGYTQRIKPYENQIFKETNSKLEAWRKSGIKKNEVLDFYREIDTQIKKMYLKEFDIEI